MSGATQPVTAGDPSQLPQHGKTGVPLWHSELENGRAWELWLEEFYMFLVDSTGAKLPVRMVVGNLLQHLSPSNRTKILELMHSKGLSRGRAHLCSLTPAASEQVSSPVLLLENQTEEDQKQLQFILDYFQALPSPQKPPSPPKGKAPADTRWASCQGQTGQPASKKKKLAAGETLYPTTQLQPTRSTKKTRASTAKCRCGKGKPNYGIKNAGFPPSWCSQCPDKPAGAVDLSRKRCECGAAIPSYGPAGSDKNSDIRWCLACPGKPQDAVNIRVKNAKKCQCGSTQPRFGLPGEPSREAKWCRRCPNKPSHAVDIVNKKCECGNSRATYGLPGASKYGGLRWCSKCPTRAVVAVDLVSKKCECGNVSATFGLPGEGREGRRWCANCPSKPASAVNVVSRRCECAKSITPTYGLLGHQAKWCLNCPGRPEEAVNVKSKRCECGKSVSPRFGYPWESRAVARWCEPSVSLIYPLAPLSVEWHSPHPANRCAQCPNRPANAVDVKNKRCECGRVRATFGMPNTTSAKWCAHCPSRPATAVDVVNKKCLCGRTVPGWGLPEEGVRGAKWCASCPGRPAAAANVRTLRYKCECRRGKATHGLQSEGRHGARWCEFCPSKPAEAVSMIIKRKRAPTS